MKRLTGSEMVPAQYIKGLFMSYAKAGKTSFLVAQALGVMPWQKYGGVITKPEHLHVIALDQDALDGIGDMLDMCKAPDEARKYDLFDMREDYRNLIDSSRPYNHSFFTTLMQVRQSILASIQSEDEVHMVIMSSFTTLSKAVERALMGPPTGIQNAKGESSGKGTGSIDLWGMLKLQMNDLQCGFQTDRYHMAWESHISRVQNKDGGWDETLQTHGKASEQWPNNTSHNFVIRRDRMNVYPDTQVNPMYIEPRASMSFISGGRNENRLNDQEPDLTVCLKKLGYRVGRWGSKS